MALLDTGGVTRGGDTNEAALLQRSWEKATVHSLSNADELRVWETTWPTSGKQSAVKVIYDRAAGEVRVLGRWERESVDNTFLLQNDLATTLKEVKEFIATQPGLD